MTCYAEAEDDGWVIAQLYNPVTKLTEFIGESVFSLLHACRKSGIDGVVASLVPGACLQFWMPKTSSSVPWRGLSSSITCRTASTAHLLLMSFSAPNLWLLLL